MQDRWQVQERDSKEKNDIRIVVNFQTKGIALMALVLAYLSILLCC